MRLVAQGLARGGRAGGAAGSAAGRTSSGGASATAGRTPVEVVRRMVAMQGQDLRQVLRAIAIRSAAGTAVADVRAAFDRGELVRSWAMRGTLFVSTPQDLAVLHGAVAERMRRQEWRMCTERGIDEATAARAAAVATAALAAGPMRRSDLLAAWQAAGIETGGGNGYHLLALLAYDELVRFGPFAATGAGDREQLLVGGAAPAVTAPQAALDEALVRFAIARGPVAADDAAWWLGTGRVAVRASLQRAVAAGRLAEAEVAGERMVLEPGSQPARTTGVTLAPGFDEWFLGYRDRSFTASPAALAAILPGRNGVFRPMVLVDGRTVGSWRIPIAKGVPAGEPRLELAEALPAARQRQIERALARWPHA
ncbi:Winged helix DNA-binding domain-containing protein [Agrococcus baldri]|uniref:Winged helix DNA-binding domain-containing protein n=2 Tax=Agrococcus baldri TaxID=153730 RepID=A0AA94HKA8_9MICO|nr:Winged helix DNA-binding domain-containing protein [Agrococcus baldri]